MDENDAEVQGQRERPETSDTDESENRTNLTNKHGEVVLSIGTTNPTTEGKGGLNLRIFYTRKFISSNSLTVVLGQYAERISNAVLRKEPSW